MTASDEERIKGAVRLVELRRVSKVVDDYKHLVQFLHFQLLGRVRDLALLLDDAPQGGLIPLVPVSLLTLRVHPQVLLDVLLDGDPAIIDVDENVDPLKHALVLLQDETDERHSFARLAGPKEDARAWHQEHHGVRGLLAGVLRRGEKLAEAVRSFCLTRGFGLGSVSLPTEVPPGPIAYVADARKVSSGCLLRLRSVTLQQHRGHANPSAWREDDRDGLPRVA